jgi:hypothetical protein
MNERQGSLSGEAQRSMRLSKKGVHDHPSVV